MGMSIDYSKGNSTWKDSNKFNNEVSMHNHQALNCFGKQVSRKNTSTLSLREEEELKETVGERRLKLYKDNNYNLYYIKKFVDGQLETERYRDVFHFLVGMEFNVYIIEKLKSMGCTDIRQEVSIKGTTIDVTAVFKGTEKLKVILEDMSEEVRVQKPGIHTIEGKAKYELDDQKYHKDKNGGRVVHQIKSARGYYKNCHVFVPKDAAVSDKINKEIRNVGGDIIRTDITKNEIVNRVKGLVKSNLH